MGDGFNRNNIIGGYKGQPIKNSMLGKNLKSRGFWSNQNPFNSATGGGPYTPLQFLWPTGTEAGGYWRFGNEGDQYQSISAQSSPSQALISATGQAIAAQLDKRISSISHSIDLNGKTKTYGGNGAQTISIGGNTVTFNNAGNADYVDFTPVGNPNGNGFEFAVAEYSKCEVLCKIENTNGLNVLVYAGNSGVNVAQDGVYLSTTLNSASGLFRVYSGSAGNNAKVTILAITGYPGLHLSQSTATSRPLSAIETIGGWNQTVNSGRFDGIDDGLSSPSFAVGTLTNNMDFFCAIKKLNLNANIPFIQSVGGSANFFGATQTGNPAPGTDHAGNSITIYVDGILVADQRNLLQAALGTNTWHVLECRNLDLSLWNQFTIGNSVQPTGMNLGTVALCPAQSQSNRDLARRIIGAEVGLLL